MANTADVSRVHDLAYVVHKDYEGVVTPRWFDPDSWGGAAELVSSGGRGGAWFVETANLSAVLRKYLRGGFVARISESAYIYLGESRVRSFAEFRLLLKLHDDGFPVPKPIAACYQRSGAVLYRGAILVERLRDSVPLADCIGHLSPDRLRSLGSTLRRFHDAGVRHADLNCFNILVREDGFYLIDFDKGKIKKKTEMNAPWKAANLARLRRSLDHLNWPQGATDFECLWAALEQGYQGIG
ncbi:3-deoxy-D-manno-octulosonic acid kinase [Marinobacter sp.]|uniref:3-deoxy-D-manno-octulosonic acid kinase n=1 Tax=Marinobacter sp. TaxID=50741 RepID=UPI003A8EF140